MDHYFDISVLPDPEFSESVLLGALYAKLHITLYDKSATNIGVSFPKYSTTLGNVVRIHGKKSDLHDLQNTDWIGGMNGHCEINSILPTPSATKFRTVSRKQPTMSQSRLRRLVKRDSITEDEIRQYNVKMLSTLLDIPYIELVSRSNGQKHRRYIELGQLLDLPVSGKFDQFGLSKTATIPWFE